MNISDVILKAKNEESFSNLLPLEKLATEAAAKEAVENGYSVAISLGKFRKAFPDVDTKHICFAPGFGTSYYWDPETLVIFPIHIVGGQFFSPKGETLAQYIENGKKAIQKEINKSDFAFIITALNDRMRMEYLKMLIEKSVPNIYSLFLTVYTSSDFGFSCLNRSDIDKVLSTKSSEDVSKTEQHIKSLPPVVTVYRGCGSESSGLNEAYSWTLDSAVALFFATRLTSEESRIHVAKVKREDIFEYIDEEESECLILPEKLFDIETFNFYDANWLDNEMRGAAYKYLDYKNNANYQKMSFASCSDIHEKSHSLRVLFFCMILTQLYSLSKEDEEILAEAALYHDTGRLHDKEDRSHGANSAKKYKRFRKVPNPIVLFLMRYHCKPDEEGYSYIESDPVLSTQKERVTLLYRIFKDADALDRFRLGKFGLDFTKLRTEEARKLPLVARITLSQLEAG